METSIAERPAGQGAAPVAEVIAALAPHFGERLATGRAIREQHANTVTWLANEAPDAVVFVESTEEVQQVVRACARHGVPVIAFGTGSSLEGQINAPQGGISIDLSRMNRVLSVHPEDLDCVVEPGVTRKQLNEHLRDAGLFFPIDPGADASLGGMASTRASGTNAVRYGTMKDNVIALTAVLANGEVITTARRAKKSSAGYDLTRLFVGAEGTLGIITSLTLRLAGIPEAISGGVCAFPTIRAACDAVILTVQTGVPIARIELLDEVQVRACNAYSRLDLAEQPTLFVEFHGTEASVHEQSQRFSEIAAEYGGSGFRWTTRPEERTRLWQARHDAYWACLPLKPGAKALATDVCVPLSRLADCVDETKRDIEEMGMVAPIVGHVGDGNFHTVTLVDMNDPQDVAKAKDFIARMIKRALAMGGTATGEHGVGQGKRGYMEAEHGGATLDAMRAIKQALDPQNIMNPGKILP
ncbi:FAD-binding oxidoreductase [Ancylobacter sp. IITR112]|uniref:FAD-binding oxidoreductase n=1 Tax=Ancylobacter sp. IITR112 TaxID=3138073 RepID=UPI00352AD335